MPWRDRTGPLGRGPRTGRGFGYCEGFSDPGFKTTQIGRGFGRGIGRGRGIEIGYGQRYGTPYSSGMEKEELKNHIAQLEEELKQAKNELKKL